jgi:nodulation protein E
VERVVVTGIGVISALGRNKPEFWGALRGGVTGIAPLTLVDGKLFRFKLGAEVPGYDPSADFDPERTELMDRFAQFAVVAAREAIADSAVEWTPGLRERTAVVTGSSLGGQTSEDASFSDLYQKARGRVHPLTIPRTMANAGASHITMEFGVTGPSFTVSTACASSAHAIGHAFWLVRSGVVDMAITGGSEAPFSVGVLKAWDALRVVSVDTCRPFSRNRRGLILGEGAAMLVLEPLAAALARGAKIWAEVVGFGASANAGHLTHPCPDGASRAMRLALADAHLPPEAIGYINAHGTGTVANDPIEIRAVRAVFNGHADQLAISSTKAMHGHALGAASAIEAAATILALHEDLLPPTVNFTEPDPECSLDIVPNKARRAQVEYALSTSFAFGGLNAVLAFRKAGR